MLPQGDSDVLHFLLPEATVFTNTILLVIMEEDITMKYSMGGIRMLIILIAYM